MVRVKLQILGLVLLAMVLGAADVNAQGRRGGFGGDRLLDLLSNSAIQKELEMSEDQVAEIEILMEDSRERRGEAMKEVREAFQNGDREAAMDRAREVFGELAKEDDTDIENLLIGEQFDRLKQLSIQRDLIGRNPGSAMDKLLDLVEATDDEKEKFDEVKERLEKEAAEKIAKIRAETVEKIARESLAAPKAEKFMEFIGKAMEGGSEAFRNRGRDDDDRGRGRGGKGSRAGDGGGKGSRGGDGGGKGSRGGKSSRGGDRSDGDNF